MLFSLSLVLVVVVLDQLTKIWIVKSFQLYESLEVIPAFFNLTYLTNKGAALVSGRGRCGLASLFFLILASVALVFVVIAWFRMRNDHRFYGPALALIAGGAIGNVIDRVRLGAVVDFLDFYVAGYHWPAFNVADSAICVGVALFCWQTFWKKNRRNKYRYRI